jgi:hypothetical protein
MSGIPEGVLFFLENLYVFLLAAGLLGKREVEVV